MEELTTFEKLHNERTSIGKGDFFKWGQTPGNEKIWKVWAIIHSDEIKVTYSRMGWLRNYILKNEPKWTTMVPLTETKKYYFYATSGKYYNVWRMPDKLEKTGGRI